jgi:hypothetical protein
MLGYCGLEIRRKVPRYYLHQYSSYEEYRDIQIKYNKKKLNRVWADETTLAIIAERVETSTAARTGRKFGLCHGSRNGFEQNYLRKLLGDEFEVIGTDISETATMFANSIRWDFHDDNPEWRNKCDFIYTNSLDQSWKPSEAIITWIGQVRIGGLIFIEHTVAHTASGASGMDPFGADPITMPYLLSEWLGHRASIEILRSKKSHRDSETSTVPIPTTSNFPMMIDGDGKHHESRNALIFRGADLDVWLFVVKRIA